MLRRVLRHPAPPAVLLAALIAFGGCTVADPYYVGERPFQAAANTPVPALREQEVWISPLQIRRGTSGDDWIDLLIAGRQANLVAAKWAGTPTSSSAINAVISVRRITPDPAPITLTTHSSLHATQHTGPGGGEHAPVYTDPPCEQFVVSIPIRPALDLGTAVYELRLVVPGPSEATDWNSPSVSIIFDERSIRSAFAN